MAHEIPNRVTEARTLVTRRIPTWLAVAALAVLIVASYQHCANATKAEADREATEATATAPTAPAPAPEPVKQVVQMPDCPTPCTMEIEEIRDLYTDGEAIYALPPGWPEEDKILYSGKGHVVIEGGNIRPGTWRFWSVDPAKVVGVRVFQVK